MTTLKCYDCVGTEDDCKKSFLEDNKDTHLIECHTENARCARSFLKKDSATVVKNSCSNQVDCNLAIIDCGKYNDVTCKVSRFFCQNYYLVIIKNDDDDDDDDDGHFFLFLLQPG